MAKVFIAAHYNMNNGDRAVLEATVEKLLEYDKNVDITVSTANPQDLSDKRFKTVGWPIKKNKICKVLFFVAAKSKNVLFFLKHLYKYLVDEKYFEAIQNSDIVLITGGHHLTDILGSRNFFNLAINYIVPIFESKKIYLMPQSIGPINDVKKKNVVKYILKNSQGIAYRDYSSKLFLDELEINMNCKYVPDIVFSMEVPQHRKKEKEIGIALYCSYVGKKKESLLPFIVNNLIDIICVYAEKGYTFSIISMDPNDINTGKYIIQKCNEKIGRAVVRIERPKSENIRDVISLFANKEMILAYKTHSVVFALINAVPVIAIAYHPKSIEFMQAMDLDDYAINDVDASAERLYVLMEKALVNVQDIIFREQKGIQKSLQQINMYIKTIFDALK